MSKKLDARYWEEVPLDEAVKGEVCVLRPVAGVATQVLYSSNGTALAALQVVVQPKDSNNIRSQAARPGAVLYSRPASSNGSDAKNDGIQRTHALVNVDGAPFAFVLTNFSHKHQLFMSLVHTNESGSKMGGLVNEINVVEPWSCLEVSGDHSAGNKRLILEAIKQSRATGREITVQQDEEAARKAKGETEGLYVSVSVHVPSNAADLVKLFDAERPPSWHTSQGADYVVVAAPPPPVSSDIRHFSFRGDGLSGRNSFSGNESSVSYGTFGTFGSSSQNAPLINFPGPYSSAVKDVASQPSFLGLTMPSSNSSPGSSFGFSIAPGSSVPNPPPNAPPPNGPHPPSQSSAFCWGFGSSGALDDQKQELILGSLASTIKHGEQVNVNSMNCETEFDPLKTSKLCVIGLSVAQGLIFAATLPPVTACRERVQLCVRAFKHGFLDVLRREHTFAPEASCCICLDDAPDTVLYPCAHQCCHFTCVQKLPADKTICPLCRTPIQACARPLGQAVIGHPRPERRALQTVPMTVLDQERELWVKERQVLLNQLAKAAEDQKGMHLRVLSTWRAALESVQREVQRQIDAVPTSTSSAFSSGFETRGLIAPSPAPSGQTVERINCPKLHALTKRTSAPPNYRGVPYTCDVCRQHTGYSRPFFHCDSCTDYDVCPDCADKALAQPIPSQFPS